MKELTKINLRLHEEQGTTEPATEPGAAGAQPAAPNTSAGQPNASGAAGTTPFKVFATQEEFDAHSAGIRKNAETRLVKSFGYETADDFRAAATQHSTTSKALAEANTTLAEANKQLEDYRAQETTFKLVSAGIDPTKVKYAQVDLAEAQVDINDEDALKTFVESSTFKLGAAEPAAEPEKKGAATKPGATRVQPRGTGQAVAPATPTSVGKPMFKRR